ncbi:MAG TPA: hypothetical protein ENJ18_17685, partial [Nannocystis exedens]|nr:hypothetical protein [Nannocystis exedens]
MQPSSALHADVAAAISELSLAEPSEQSSPGSGLGRFTVARTEALLRLREIPRAPWEWTCGLLRAALSLVRFARVAVISTETDSERLLEFQFVVPGASLESAFEGVGELLALALEASPTGLREPTPEEGLCRWRVAVATALNAGLAGDPLELCLITPAGSRVLHRREGSVAERHDPYRQHRDPERCPPGSFIVRLRETRPSFGRRLASFLALRGRVEDDLETLWRRALVLWGGEEGLGLREGIDLQRRLPGDRIRLGEHALWGRMPELGGPWLVRDGIKILDLSAVLREHDLDSSLFAGWIDCPTLRLTADLATVARDQAFELLLAWLGDAQAHSFPGSGSLPKIVWPSEVAHVTTASGRPAPIEQIQKRAMGGADFPYEWPHRRAQVPKQVQARVFVVWPSELAALREQLPELRPVPQRNLGAQMGQARTDLGGLASRSLPEIELGLSPPTIEIEVEGASAVEVTLQLTAYVHRQSSATAGAIVLLAYGRRVAQSRDDGKNLPGVTLICAVEGQVGIDELRRGRGALQVILGRCREAMQQAQERLLRAACATANPWEIPLVRASALAAGPATVGLCYRIVDGHLRLSFRDCELSKLSIGTSRAGQEKRLSDALVELGERGGVVVEHESRRWPSLDPEDAENSVWSLHAYGRDLCERVLGRAALWTMPIATQAQLRPIDVAEQRHLLLSLEGCRDHLERMQKRPRSRAALVAHLLVARMLGEPTHGLEKVALFIRYDPRALSASTLVSLDDISAAKPRLQLCPAGAVHRDLPEPVIEVEPGEAQLLHRLLNLAPALPQGEGRGEAAGVDRRARRPAIRRHSQELAPLVTLPVVDEIAAGALRIDDPDSPAAIALWAGGLHIDDLTLPAPLDCIAGRLWLTHAGIKAGTDKLAARLRDLSRELVRRALDQRLLHLPGSREAQAIAALIVRLQAAAADDRSWVADLLPSRSTGLPRQQVLARSLDRLPLRRLLGGGSERLTQVLRQSLSR